MKPTFTVCCIVRNGASTLPRLFDSLREFERRGGQMIVMDTGSSDQTVKVARSCGALVYEVGEQFRKTIRDPVAAQINARFVAEGDAPVVEPGSRLFHFSEARNHCASLASNDWVSWADSDEAFTALGLDWLEEVLADPELEHLEYDFVFAHAEDGVTPAMNFTQSKMYRKSRICWSGAVHEVITRLNGSTGKHRFVPPEIFHLEHWQEKADHRANYLPGLAWDAWMKLEHDPAGNRDRQWHYLGRELLYCHRYRSAIKVLEEHVQMNGWPAERAQSLVFMGDCYGSLGEPAKQLTCYHDAFHTDPSRRVALLRLAGFYRSTGSWQASLCFARAAMQIPWHGGFYADDRREYAAVPHWYAYLAAGWLGRIGEAQEEIGRALAYEPNNPEFLDNVRYYARPCKGNPNEPLVSICIPTLGREEKLARCLAAILRHTDWPYELVIEKDHFGPQRQGCPRLLAKCVERSKGRYICFLGNDTIPQEGWLRNAMNVMMEFPQQAGMVGFNDGYWRDGRCLHWVISRDLLPALDGEFLHTGYHHVGCDDELIARCTRMERYQWAEDAVVLHDHFVSGAPMDEVYLEGWDRKKVEQDRALLETRAKSIGFAPWLIGKEARV